MPFTDVPPSYASSTTQSPLPLIAPYLPSSTLVSLCLVSRRFYSIFIPFLWGDPASHFGIANDAVYVALTRFKRTLRKARPETRGLTHTLHLPPALSEIYGGPRTSWLRDVLEGLPNLQSLIVGGLPFFDHGSLMALRAQMVPRRDVYGDPLEGPGVWEDGYGLKLLLAGSEPNTTSLGLSIALPRFPSLVYLDLSFTKSAKDAGVLAALGWMGELQALKLQGIGLRDGEAEVLANSIGVRVRLLDVRNNVLTDMAVRSLMQACFLGPRKEPRNGVDRLNTRMVEDWPVGMAPGPDFFSLDTLRSEDLDRELLKQLTNPLTGRLAFEEIPQGGLTHLYISGNNLSVEGLASLLKTERLHILDGGSVDTVKTISRTRSLSTSSGYVDEVKFPGAEKLVPILAQSASKNLTYLRVDHAVVTGLFEPPVALEKRASINRSKRLSKTSTSDEPVSPVAEVSGDTTHAMELPASLAYAVELPSDNHPIYEMDATPMQPRAELPGDMIYFAVSPPIGTKPEQNQARLDDVPQGPRRGSGAFAPEVDVDGTYHGLPPPPMENGNTAQPNGTAVVPAGTHDVSDEGSTNSTVRSLRSPVSPITPHGTFQPLVAPTTAPSKPSPGSRPPQSAETSTMATTVHRPISPAPTPTSIRHARIDYLMSLRPPPNSIISAATTPMTLHPSHLPNLRTLVLTSVPLSVPASSLIISRLKAFISACAIESVLSHLLAATDYSLPPGKARHLAEIRAARRHFALQTIVLEMAQPSSFSNNHTGNDRAWQSSRAGATNNSKSSTGDRDSEALWSAAADDFSFFAEDGGEEEDECGIYGHEKEKYFPTAAVWDDKILLSPDDAERGDSPVIGQHRRHNSHGEGSGTLSPIHALDARGATVSGATSAWKSPRDLPMGRNRRLSNEPGQGRRAVSPIGRGSFDGGGTYHHPQQQRTFTSAGQHTAELPGTMPTSSPVVGQQRRMQSRSQRPGSLNSPALHNPTPTANQYGISPPISPLEPQETQLDLVSELAAFRKQRKAAYEAEVLKFRRFKAGLRPEDTEGLIEPFVEGFWEGKIEIVRDASKGGGRKGVGGGGGVGGLGRAEKKWMVDYYGNRFDGFLYP